jgi:hypothetical protein
MSETDDRNRDAFLRVARIAVDFAKKEADRRRTAAGYNGSHHDNGAAALEGKIELWFQTLTRPAVVPQFMVEFWTKALAEIKTEENRRDPEWAEYERLKSKFEGR